MSRKKQSIISGLLRNRMRGDKNILKNFLKEFERRYISYDKYCGHDST